MNSNPTQPAPSLASASTSDLVAELDRRMGAPEVSEAINAAAAHFGVKPIHILGRRMSPALNLARTLAVWWAKRDTGWDDRLLASAFARDPKTIRDSIHRANDLRHGCDDFRAVSDSR